MPSQSDLDLEEIYRIINMGAELKLNSYIEKLKPVIDEYDSVFIGTGAPKGKDLKLKGREISSENIHIGIDWLTSIAFEHTSSVGKKVIVFFELETLDLLLDLILGFDISYSILNFFSE